MAAFINFVIKMYAKDIMTHVTDLLVVLRGGVNSNFKIPLIYYIGGAGGNGCSRGCLTFPII